MKRRFVVSHCFTLAALGWFTTTPANARVISFPMHLEHAFVRQLLVEEMFTGANESSQVWQDDGRCSDIVLSQPKLAGRDGKLHIIANFNAKLGAGVGKWCLNVTDWSGILDAAMEPHLHPSLPIVNFRVVDSDMYGTDGEKHFTGTLWDWVKSRVHPRLETIRIDLFEPINELKMFLPILFPGTDFDRMEHLLDSIALADVTVGESDITLRVQLDVPEPAPTTPVQPLAEPTLTADELERWDQAWQSWDGFLTFLIKHSSQEASEQLRRDLREVFLEARYDIIEILRPTKTRASDPVRPLFLKTWKRLAPIMRQLTTSLPGEAALRYMSFITAADALSALEQLGPEYGVEINADGLRRMARMVEPAPFGDPVSYSEAVDPELRKLFGFGAPPPTPELTEEDLVVEETPAANDEQGTATMEESPTPEQPSTPEVEPTPSPVAEADGEHSFHPEYQVCRMSLWFGRTEVWHARAENQGLHPWLMSAAPAGAGEVAALEGRYSRARGEAPGTAAARDTTFICPAEQTAQADFRRLLPFALRQCRVRCADQVALRARATTVRTADPTAINEPRTYKGKNTGGLLDVVSQWLMPRAWATTDERKLDRWIPTRDEVLEYLPRVHTLLDATAKETVTKKKLETRYSSLYRSMMLATAWQESCWRQFIKKGGTLQPLTSPVGAVGIMQVNVRVWRGFYEQQSLRNSMKYNAEAGSEILLHYLVDYAIAKGEHTVRNDVEDLARATYAAYNAGPAGLRRYRRKSGHRIDQAFWKKYQQIKSGDELAVASCFGITRTG